MKKLLIFITVLFASVAYGQDECNSLWPYMFVEFEEAQINFNDGKQTKLTANVHYVESTLQYLEKGLIRHSAMSMISSVILRGYEFIVVDGIMILAEAKSDDGFVGMLTTVDMNRLGQSSGAYGIGADANSTSDEIKLNEIGGVVPNVKIDDLLGNLELSKALYLKSERYLVVDGVKYKASKSAVTRDMSKEVKKEFKTFEKENKINWNNPQSILKVVEFLKAKA